jgi:hypothetical protein
MPTSKKGRRVRPAAFFYGGVHLAAYPQTKKRAERTGDLGHGVGLHFHHAQ